MRDARCCSRFGGTPRCGCCRLLPVLLEVAPCCRRCCHSSRCCADAIPATVRSSVVTCMSAQRSHRGGRRPGVAYCCVPSLHDNLSTKVVHLHAVCLWSGAAAAPRRTCCVTISWNLAATSAKLPLSSPPNRSTPFNSRNRHSSSSPEAGPPLAPCNLRDRLCVIAAEKELCLQLDSRSAQ